MKNHAFQCLRKSAPFIYVARLSLMAVTYWLVCVPAFAVPTFTWSEPWRVTLQSGCSSIPGDLLCRGFESKSFGSVVGNDRISDTTADRAVAHSFTGKGSGGSGGASATVRFARRFSVFGSLDGWVVQLDGRLTGQLFAAGGGGATAEVAVSASVGPDLNVQFSKGVNGSNVARESLDIHLRDATVLADGNYELSGMLHTLGGFGGCPCIGSATADWDVGLTAIPLPEPGTWLLLLSGLGVVFVRQLRGEIAAVCSAHTLRSGAKTAPSETAEAGVSWKVDMETWRPRQG